MQFKKIYSNFIGSIAVTAVALAGSALVSSCEDELELKSYTADDIDYAFKDEFNAEVYVRGCYRGLIHEENFRQLNTGETITIPTEELLQGSKWAVGNYHFDPLQPYGFSRVWSEGYRIIEATNVGLKYITRLPESPKRNALMAELYFLRAYCYHNIIRVFGDCPARFTPLEDMDDADQNKYYPTRDSRDEIYDRIIKEMEDNVEFLPLWSESGYGIAPERITRQAGYGIIARICLHAAGYSLRWDLKTNDPSTLRMERRQDQAKVDEFYRIADQALAKALNNGHSLITSGPNGMSGFQHLFTSYCKREYAVSSQEMMWQLASLGESTNSSFNVYSHPGSTSGAFGGRKAMQVKLPTYYVSFDPKDTRRDVSCANYSITNAKNDKDPEYIHVGTCYSSVMGGKFRIQWGVEPQEAAERNMDIPMLRYADILLMYAETQNYLHHGPTAAGIAALQEVRNRAGVGHLPVPNSEQDFLEAVMQERKWEFADEFLLRTDLIRTDLLDKHIAECKQDLKDFSDHTGKYVNVPQYRIYKYSINEQVYGDTFLSVPYIDVTDPAEVEKIAINPRVNNKSTFIKNVKEIVAAHGEDWGDGWYPCRLFERIGSTYNKNSRNYLCGINTAMDIQAGIAVAKSHTGRAENVENRGVYPEWIDGPVSVFYGYKRNQTELSPLAAKQAGHIMIDNPRMTQLPGYPGPSTAF